MSPHWRGGTYTNPRGYVFVWLPDHPAASHGYVKRSRWVMEQKLGRRLLPAEAVHHVNSDKQDDRPENLQLLTQSEHLKGHRRAGTVPGPCGIKNRAAKLTDEKVREIRSQHPAKSITALARDYGMGETAIAYVIKRKTWKHVA